MPIIKKTQMGYNQVAVRKKKKKSMNQYIEQRLRSLKTEFEAGQKILAEYEEKQRNLRETLLRISGAIQVLEEVLENADSEANGEVYQPQETTAELQPLAQLAASSEET